MLITGGFSIKEKNTIAAIRKEFTAINSPAKEYKVVEAEVEGLSTEGGNIKKYYDSTILRKAILTLHGEVKVVSTIEAASILMITARERDPGRSGG